MKPGESVVGMAIPRRFIEDGLGQLQGEIKFFGSLIRDLQECIEGRHDDVKFHSIYSSDLGLDLYASLQVASQFANIVSVIKSLLEKLREYRKVKEKVEELGLDKEVVDSIEKKARAAVEEKLDEIEAEVFQECSWTITGELMS